MNRKYSQTYVTGRIPRGFTLVELMIVVVIIGVLVAIAYPSYRNYVIKSNRSAAESVIMSAANRQEQFMLDARQYSTASAVLGVVPDDVDRNYDFVIAADNAATPPTYSITANPAGAQTADSCGSVSVNQAGTKAATGGTVAECW